MSMSPLPIVDAYPATPVWLDRLAAPGFAVLVVSVVALLLAIGYPAPTAFGWSNAILLDGGWRVAEGQVPHVDFHSPIGPLYFGALALVMRIGGADPAALSWLAALTTAVLAIPAWLIARARLPPIWAALLAGLICLHAAAITVFGSSGTDAISYAGQYSRLGWALFLLLAVQSLLPARHRSSSWRPALLAGVAGGVLAGCLFSIKGTYLAGAVACLGIGVCLWWPGRRLVFSGAVVLGGLVAVALSAVLSGAWPWHYLADLAMVARGGRVGVLGLVVGTIVDLDSRLVIAALMTAGLAWCAIEGRQAQWRLCLVLGTAAGTGVLMSASNGSEFMGPMWTILPLLAVAVAAVGPVRSSQRSVFLAAVAVAALVMTSESVRLLRPLVGVLRIEVATPAVDEPQLGAWSSARQVLVGRSASEVEDLHRSLEVDSRIYNAQLWRLALGDGLALLRPQIRPGDRVLTLDVVNPFPFALHQPAPRGVLLYWHFDRNISERAAMPPEQVLADVSVVALPRRPVFLDSAHRLEAWCRPVLDRDFELVAESPWWQILRRRGDG